MLIRTDKALRQFKQETDRLGPFGGIVVLICCDFGQLPPVQDTALMDAIVNAGAICCPYFKLKPTRAATMYCLFPPSAPST
ncbi:hypothetical protein BCR44DRAFT_33845 [Catenaria anguillulae PL171]|uniref:ATP-dependent DNA helicase n=1 Tax=Catenaria anguillulae PL171 TaxID=765915 RepID=A0A1Y2HN43_9FUNG|nr:hypothetical protein BCR44DRAFT_33845 [Catenaria anguillulae PL171]